MESSSKWIYVLITSIYSQAPIRKIPHSVIGWLQIEAALWLTGAMSGMNEFVAFRNVNWKANASRNLSRTYKLLYLINQTTNKLNQTKPKQTPPPLLSHHVGIWQSATVVLLLLLLLQSSYFMTLYDPTLPPQLAFHYRSIIRYDCSSVSQTKY